MRDKPDQGNLFDVGTEDGDHSADGMKNSLRPLAVRMRPSRLSQVRGHANILGPDCLLPRLVKANTFGSLLFYGPPGCGKTTLAEVIAAETSSRFIRINAVLSNVAEMRDVLRLARYEEKGPPLLFIDEIHRFNKAQQDLLLPDVEAGNVRLIGATTHNPGFYIIPPLLSRSHLFRLEPLQPADIQSVLEAALDDRENGLGNLRISAAEGTLDVLSRMCDGDLRRGLNALETLARSLPIGGKITSSDIEVFARERRIRYDANEDEHYDTISAFIKSVRGGDPDAAMYWLAKMLEGGEDPRFIARRLVILASEDIGLADSRALPLAAATFQACDWVGMPECRLNLAHCTLFLACAPKSNSATLAIARAQKTLKEQPVQPVPEWLRDGHNQTGRKLGYGKDYRCSHDYPDGISGQNYLLEELDLYVPVESGSETAIAQRLAAWKQSKRAIQNRSQDTPP